MQFSLGSVDILFGGVPGVSIPIPGTTQLQAMYDTFCIEKVEIRMFAGSNSASNGSEETGIAGVTQFNYRDPLPIIGYAPDTDDSGNTTMVDLQQYSTHKQKQLVGGDPIVTSVVPCVATALYASPFSTSYARKALADVNCGNPGTPHYGMKMYVDGLRASSDTAAIDPANTLVSFFFKLHFRMKTTR